MRRYVHLAGLPLLSFAGIAALESLWLRRQRGCDWKSYRASLLRRRHSHADHQSQALQTVGFGREEPGYMPTLDDHGLAAGLRTAVNTVGQMFYP